MEPSRDHFGLLEAMKHVRVKYPEAHLILAGAWQSSSAGELAALGNGLKDCVEFLGEVGRPESIYPTLDLYVQASAVKEGTSNSIIEAMSSGLPVIATDLGGNKEVVESGVTGLLVQPRDTVAMARAILNLLDDPDSRPLDGG